MDPCVKGSKKSAIIIKNRSSLWIFERHQNLQDGEYIVKSPFVISDVQKKIHVGVKKSSSNVF